MPALVIPEALQVTVRGTNQGTPWANVWGVHMNANVFTDQALADAVGAAFEGVYYNLGASMNDQWRMSEIIVTDIQSATGPAFDADIAEVQGATTSTALPPQLAVVASHTTGLRGRSYQGRTYFGGWTQQAMDAEGQVTAATRGLILDQIAALRSNLAALAGGPFYLAVLSRKLLVATPITGSRVDLEFDRQDRRKRV